MNVAGLSIGGTEGGTDGATFPVPLVLLLVTGGTIFLPHTCEYSASPPPIRLGPGVGERDLRVAQHEQKLHTEQQKINIPCSDWRSRCRREVQRKVLTMDQITLVDHEQKTIQRMQKHYLNTVVRVISIFSEDLEVIIQWKGLTMYGYCLGRFK